MIFLMAAFTGQFLAPTLGCTVCLYPYSFCGKTHLDTLAVVDLLS